jgi:hypothetical protein
MKLVSFKGLLILIVVAIVIAAGYLYLQKSNLLNGDSDTGAYIGQSFPPILFLDYKAGIDKGCYEMKWSSLNVTSCTASWKPTIHTSGIEQVCQGTGDAEGVRQISPNIGNMVYTVSCTGPAGSVSRTINIKNN